MSSQVVVTAGSMPAVVRLTSETPKMALALKQLNDASCVMSDACDTRMTSVPSRTRYL